MEFYKTNSKGSERKQCMLHEVDLNSLDVSNLLWDIQKTCVTNEDIELLWEIKNVWLVKNKNLEDRYEKKRNLMKKLGRSDDQTQDDLLFMAEGWNNVNNICNYGPCCREKKNNVLGDTQYGIHMNRHYDILARFMAFKNFQQANYIVVLRAMLGRVKKVKPFLTGEYGCIAPTPNYDSHVSEDEPDLASIDICDAIAYNFVYMYEYDEETILPMTFPSHVLPLAVIRLFRTRNRLVRPVKYKREKDLAKSKNAHRLNNETKPLKHLPRAAPHKKYVVEGRRSGTRLISDVPIEPPSDNPPTETTKKLEKFRRASAVSGGTGMGHLFYKRPFNKMPMSWQRKFGFHSKRHRVNTSRRTEKRRRRSSKEPEKRRKSISRSPTPPPIHRDKNLFEIFDKSLLNQEDFSNETSGFNLGTPNGHILRQQTDFCIGHYMTSRSSDDTGCNETGNRNIFGSHTPTKDERYCKDIDCLSSNSEHGMISGSNTMHTSKTPRICTELKNSSRRPDDNHWMRSNEFSSCFTPESATSTHDLSRKETIKEVSASSIVNNSSGLQHTPAEPIYQLVRITIDEPDTPSIYHELRGIKLPTCDKKTIKDPRVLRAMGCVIESPVMAGFGPFLRRIKNEPPDDPSYENKTKNILPLESIKKEPESGENEDDVEKVLKELDNAIKAIQHKKDEVGPTAEDKKDDESTTNCKDGKPVDDTKAKEQSAVEDDKKGEDNDGDFLPRNKGFSSYLPEYSKNSDYERTTRLLTEVFGEKALSPTKKVPMSMSDYFGSSNPNVSINSTTETNIEHRLSDINSDSQPKHTEQIAKKSPEKETAHISKAKNSTEAKSPIISHENKKKGKHNENLTSSSSGVSRPSKLDNEKSTHPIKIKSEPKSVKETSKERSRSRSLHSSHKTRSRSRSHSRSKTDKRKSKKSKKRSAKSQSSSKTGRDRSRSNSPCAKRKKYENHKSAESSQSLEKKRSRSRSQSHISRERKRSGSMSSCGRSWSNGSNGSRTRQKHKLSSSVIKVNNESKSTKKSRAKEILARENSPGRLQYLEQRRKMDTSKYMLNKAKRYQEGGIMRRHDSEIETDVHYQKVFDKTRQIPEDNMNTFGDHMDSYTDIMDKTGFSDNKAATTSDETVVNSTLSKAMTSLLKKIVFRDDRTDDDSAEGRMADMVIELVKDQMSKELKSDIPTTGPSTSTGQSQSVHPFVPYLKQERSMDELYSSNPWNASANGNENDASFSRNEYYDDYMEQAYQNDGPGDNRSFHGRRPAYPPRIISNVSRQEHYGESRRGSYRGKLYSYTMPEKARGSSHRGRIKSTRGGFHPRGRRGSRGRTRGRSSYSSSSYGRYTKDKNNYGKK